MCRRHSVTIRGFEDDAVFPSSLSFEDWCSPRCFDRLSFRVDSPLWRACLRGLGPTDPRFGSRKLWPLSWVLPPAAARCCRCFRRWCGCRGLVGRTGLQTSMRTGCLVALKTASNNREDTPRTTTHLPPPSPSFLPLDSSTDTQRGQPP